MDSNTSALPTTALLAGVLVTLGFLLYQAALPKPIAGIPCARSSINRLFGDVPDALKYHAKTSETVAFLASRCEELKSPIVQVFVRPFSRPWVVLADSRESQDIMIRRTREFDRSSFHSDLLGAVVPNPFQMTGAEDELTLMKEVVMRTNDQWRHNRRLVNDAMSPRFLSNIASQQVYNQALNLVELWRQKMRLSKGHAFNLRADLQLCTADSIWATTFGDDIAACKVQSDYLRSLDSIKLLGDEEALAEFPAKPNPDAYAAWKAISESGEIPMNSPLGRHHHWFAVTFFPYLRAAISLKNKIVNDKVQTAWEKAKTHKASESTIDSIVDLVVDREVALAKKEGRVSEHDSKFVYDELAGFMIAGVDPTATNMGWGLKYLAKHNDVQTRLRKDLREAFPSALQEGRPPRANDVVKARIPYLDAFIDEVLRHSGGQPTNVRVAINDTEILGYQIPKGTDVFMLTMGPSYKSPALPIDESIRSQSSREFQKDSEKWAHEDLGSFNPDRWLVRNEQGEIEFDSRAAPMQAFGAGMRACYGRKLAYLEMRIIYALVIWNLEVLSPPEALFDFKAVDKLSHQPQNVYMRFDVPK
ncbi:cytochrome P450 [Usnea florida]